MQIYLQKVEKRLNMYENYYTTKKKTTKIFKMKLVLLNSGRPKSYLYKEKSSVKL